MYVARVAGHYITKRMPGTGVQHDPGCELYEAPPELSGFGDVVGRVIQEDTDAGVTVLRLGFSLSRTGRKPAPAAADGEGVFTIMRGSGNEISLFTQALYVLDKHRFITRDEGVSIIRRKKDLRAARPLGRSCE